MSDFFAHLRVHSTFSLSEGASKVDALVARARATGIPALALTDRNNLFGAMVFSKEASSKGVQPLVGCQLSIEWADGKRGNVLLLAQDAAGYGNLCAILGSVSAPRPGKDGKPSVPLHPVIDPDTLRDRAAGLLLLTGGGTDGLLPQLVAKADGTAEETFGWLLSVFGDRLYVEICRNGPPTAEGAATEDALIALACGSAGDVACWDGIRRSEAPLVATSDIWYATPDRHEAWVLLGAVVNKTTVTMDGDTIVGAGQACHHMRTAAEMRDLFDDLPEAYANAANVAARCSFLVKGRKPILPPFACGAGRTEVDELRAQAKAGLEARLAKAGISGPEASRHWDRLTYELGVIETMGFPGYFLIVSDFIKWAKSQDIPVGPGRGSGAGSIVAWALTITDLDPLEFNLLFERFLNPERVSMPDFDIDFCQDRREEVRDYVKRKYGADKVALIATFGYIKSKTALTDMQRILVHQQHGTVGFNEVKELTKSIPKKEDSPDPMGLEEAYLKAADFRGRVDKSEKLLVLYNQARRVEGLIRTSGAHAAGVVIGDRPLDELVPVTYDPVAAMPVAGYDMKGVEAAGLVKFDFLGLTTLSVLHLALRYVREFRGEDLDLSVIPRDDAEVFQRLSDGQCTGVFQFEGEGMRKVMRQIRPTRFEDLIAIVALFRPGPMAYIDTYAARKQGHEEFEYPGDQDLTRPFLEETYGIMVYQEQVMQVAQTCAGYSLGGADLLRRAIGKKIAAEMTAQERIFVDGATAGFVEIAMDNASLYKVHRRARLHVGETDGLLTAEEIQAGDFTPVLSGLQPSRQPPSGGGQGAAGKISRLRVLDDGMSGQKAKDLFADVEKFSGYGFNKSHAAAYAWIGYQTAWMKTHYPAEYLSALMTYYTDKPDRLALIKDELEALGVPLLPPDANNSHGLFRPEQSPKARGGLAVRFGLAAIKQISGAGADLAAERSANGPFISLEDFFLRTGARFNKGQYERLAEAGAFDGLGCSRRAGAEVLGWLASHKSTAPAGQDDMFGGPASVQAPQQMLAVPEWADAAEREFRAVGFYFSRHPIDPFIQRLITAGVRRRQSFFHWMLENSQENLEGRKLCAMVDSVQIRQTKRGTTYVEAQVSERSDTYRVACYEDRRGGMSVDQVRQVLDGAKASRRPIVFLCSLAMDRDQKGLWVNGRGVWDVEEFLAGVRGDIVIRLDPAQMTLMAADTAAARPASEPGAPASATDQQAVRRAAASRVVDQLRGRLEEHARSGDGSGSGITIETPDTRTSLQGRFKIPMWLEHIIRQTDGVVSIQDVAARAGQADGAEPPRRAA